jgi:hypothetical protein
MIRYKVTGVHAADGSEERDLNSEVQLANPILVLIVQLVQWCASNGDLDVHVTSAY